MQNLIKQSVLNTILTRTTKRKLYKAYKILQKFNEEKVYAQNRINDAIKKIVKIFENKQILYLNELVKNCTKIASVKDIKEMVIKTTLVPKQYSKLGIALRSLKCFKDQYKKSMQSNSLNNQEAAKMLVKKLKNKVLYALQKLKLLSAEQNYKIFIEEQVLENKSKVIRKIIDNSYIGKLGTCLEILKKHNKDLNDSKYQRCLVVKQIIEHSSKNKVGFCYNILKVQNEQIKMLNARKESTLSKVCNNYYKFAFKPAFDLLRGNLVNYDKQILLKQQVMDRFISQVYVKIMMVFNKLVLYKNSCITGDISKSNTLKKMVLYNIKPLSIAMRALTLNSYDREIEDKQKVIEILTQERTDIGEKNMKLNDLLVQKTNEVNS